MFHQKKFFIFLSILWMCLGKEWPIYSDYVKMFKKSYNDSEFSIR